MQTAPDTKYDWARLKRLGITSYAQLILYLPSKFEDYANVTRAVRAWVDDPAKRVYRVTATGLPIGGGTPPKVSIQVMAEDGPATMTAFGPPQGWSDLQEGDVFHVLGTVREFGGRIYLNASKRIPERWAGKIKPKYARPKGVLSDESHAAMLEDALALHVDDAVRDVQGWFENASAAIPECTPAEIRLSLVEAHRPTSIARAEAAIAHIERLAAREMLQRAKRMAESRKAVHGAALELDPHLVKRMIEALPYRLTNDQLQAMREIVRDLRGDTPMNRLLSGDVGTGKTITYLLPLMAAAAKNRVAVVTYNVPLANSLARDAEALARSVGADIPVSLITGGKKSALPERGIVVGTSAVINHALKHGWEPDALVIDEQHKAGKKQRQALKNDRTNYLEATATCIPQTGAFVLSGGMDLSVLRERPYERRVKTAIYGPHDRRKLFALLQETVNTGKQAAIIYPTIGGTNEKAAAGKIFGQWQKHFGARAALLHGKMADTEKESVLAAFREGRLSVMVTTMMVELGLTLPDLSAMVVVDPIRFSIVTLHQLRGRIARNGGNGQFCLYQRDDADPGRLNALIEHDDGFKIAEVDMLERGAGDLEDDDAQHGKTTSILPGRSISMNRLTEILG